MFIFHTKYIVDNTSNRKEFLYKQNYSGFLIATFKQKLRKVNWNKVKQSNNASKYYAKFFEVYTSLYDEYFPQFRIRLN